MKRSLLFLAAASGMLAMATSAALAQTPELRVCTGLKTGGYYLTAAEIAKQLGGGSVNITVIETQGSTDNLRQLSAGTCDAAIVQSDAYGQFAATNPTVRLDFQRTTPLYSEYVHLFCNKDAGVHSVRDLLGSDKSVVIGTAGTGTQVTWDNWARQSPDYQKVQTHAENGDLALLRVLDGTENQCMLSVSRLNTGTMAKVNELGKGELDLVSINDDWFDDVKDPKGQPVYQFSKIPANTYSNLQNFGFLGGSADVDTLVLEAILVTNSAWISANPTAYADFATAAVRWKQQHSN